MKTTPILWACAAVLLAAGKVAAYERLQGPTELLYWDQDRACQGYTLFSARGTYLIDMEGQVVWSYQSKSPQGFFSHIGSGAQRLPNGNTLICAMTEGHFFEVTAEGELVWEYINPVTRDGAVKVLPDSLPMTNAVFRAYRYSPDHPALQGKDLSPKGTITDRYAQGLDRDLAPRRPPQGDRGTEEPGRRGRRGGGQGEQRSPGDRGPDARVPGGGVSRQPQRDLPRGAQQSPDGRPAGPDRRGPGAGQDGRSRSMNCSWTTRSPLFSMGTTTSSPSRSSMASCINSCLSPPTQDTVTSAPPPRTATWQEIF